MCRISEISYRMQPFELKIKYFDELILYVIIINDKSSLKAWHKTLVKNNINNWLFPCILIFEDCFVQINKPNFIRSILNR